MLKLLGGIAGVGAKAKEVPMPPMQIVDWNVIISGSKSETWVIAHKESKLYFAITKGHLPEDSIGPADPSTWTDTSSCRPPEEINLPNVYPRYQFQFTKYQPSRGEADTEVYRKHRRLNSVALRCGPNTLISSDFVARTSAREIRFCERLRANPHPSIVEYRGVDTHYSLPLRWQNKPIELCLDQERVTSLVFKRYDYNLFDLIYSKLKVDARHCLLSIAAAIEHLHSMGIVHADIKP